jgi:hypothetical protein
MASFATVHLGASIVVYALTLILSPLYTLILPHDEHTWRASAVLRIVLVLASGAWFGWHLVRRATPDMRRTAWGFAAGATGLVGLHAIAPTIDLALGPTVVAGTFVEAQMMDSSDGWSTHLEVQGPDGAVHKRDYGGGPERFPQLDTCSPGSQVRVVDLPATRAVLAETCRRER